MLYKSTYSGEDPDSDHDEFHITKPFKHSDKLHHEILHNTAFESDESHQMEDDEKDEFLATCLTKQASVLDSLHKAL